MILLLLSKDAKLNPIKDYINVNCHVSGYKDASNEHLMERLLLTWNTLFQWVLMFLWWMIRIG